MKERLINNLGLKILSIFLAFFVWLVVVNVSNPWVKGTQEVPLEIENEQVLLAANRTYELTGKNTVTIAYRVQARDENRIRSTDFRAYINLAELYDVTGSVPVQVEVLNNRTLMEDVEPRQRVVQVETEELQRKRFDLTYTTTEPAEGYALNGVSITPSYIYVEGPISQVGQISHVGIEIDLGGQSEDVSAVTEPVYYDSNDNKINPGSRVVSNTTEIQYQATINRVKKLPLDFEVSGSVASGYVYVGVECNTSTISVTGLKTSLASLNKLTVPASVLNLDGAASDRVITVNLEDYLPQGVQIVQSENTQIQVRLKVERLINRTIRLTDKDIRRAGASESYLYRFAPAQIDVTLQGLKEDLDGLSASSLGASINLAGLEPGNHKGVLTFEENEAFRVISYKDFEVEVSLKEPGITAESSSVQETTTASAAMPSSEAEPEGTEESGLSTSESEQTTPAG